MKLWVRSKFNGNLNGPAIVYVYGYTMLGVNPNGMNDASTYLSSLNTSIVIPGNSSTVSQSPQIPSYGSATATTALCIPCYQTEAATIIGALSTNMMAPTSTYTDKTENRTITALGVSRSIKFGVYWAYLYGPRYAKIELLPK